jgi:AcrR family transcriptional regulator
MDSPRQRRHEITKQRIIDAARKILVEQGLVGLSIRTLANQIDYTPSAIYKYFESKEDILRAIRQEGFALGSKLQSEAIAVSMTPPEKMLASGRAYLRFAELYPEYYQLMFNSTDLPPASIQAITSNPKFASVPQAINEGLAQGYFHLPPGYTVEMLALQAWITVHGMAMLKLGVMHSVQADFGALCDQILQAFITNLTSN